MKNTDEAEAFREGGDGMEGRPDGVADVPVEEDECQLLVDLVVIGKLRARIGQKGLDELLEILFEDFPCYLSELYAAAEKCDRGTLHRVAHAMQSSSGTLGLKALSDQCGALSDVSGQMPLVEARYRIAAIEDTYGRTATFLFRNCFGKKKGRC